MTALELCPGAAWAQNGLHPWAVRDDLAKGSAWSLSILMSFIGWRRKAEGKKDEHLISYSPVFPSTNLPEPLQCCDKP